MSGVSDEGIERGRMPCHVARGGGISVIILGLVPIDLIALSVARHAVERRRSGDRRGFVTCRLQDQWDRYS